MNGVDQYQKEWGSSFYDAKTNNTSKPLISGDKISKSEDSVDAELAQFNRQQDQLQYQQALQNDIDFQIQNQQNQQKQEEYKYFLREFLGDHSIDKMKEKLADPKVQEKAMEMLRDYQNGNINDPNLRQTISNLANNPQLQEEFKKQEELRKTETKTINVSKKVGMAVGAIGAAVVGCIFLGPWGLLLGLVGALVGWAVGLLVGMTINLIRRGINKLKQLCSNIGNAIGNFFSKWFGAQSIRDKVFGKNTNTLDYVKEKMDAKRARTRDQMKYNNQKVCKSNKIKINKDKIKAYNKWKKNEKPIGEKPIEKNKSEVKNKINKQSKKTGQSQHVLRETKYPDGRIVREYLITDHDYNNAIQNIADTLKEQGKNKNQINSTNGKGKTGKKTKVNKDKIKAKQKHTAKHEKQKSKLTKHALTSPQKGLKLEQKNHKKSTQTKTTPKSNQKGPKLQLNMNQNSKATGMNTKGVKAQSKGMSGGKGK